MSRQKQNKVRRNIKEKKHKNVPSSPPKMWLSGPFHYLFFSFYAHFQDASQGVAHSFAKNIAPNKSAKCTPATSFNCDDHSSLDFKSAVRYVNHFIYHFTPSFCCFMFQIEPENKVTIQVRQRTLQHGRRQISLCVVNLPQPVCM